MKRLNIPKLKANRRGDTIVEVLISIAILGIVLTAAYVSTSHSLQSGTDAGNRSVALGYAQQQIEYMKAIVANAGGSTSTQNTDLTKTPGSKFYISNNGTTLNVVYCPSSPQVCPTITGTSYTVYEVYNTGIYTLTVSWPRASGGSPNSLTLYYKTSG